MIVVSSCLLGKKCRYDGNDSLNAELVHELKQSGVDYFGLCPEVLGGLSVPRTACEIVGGAGREVLEGSARILNLDGQDVTVAFVRGAADALRICKEREVTQACLKSRSPSCGYGEIHDGSFSGKLRTGNGVFAEFLKQNGVKVISV